LGNYWLGELGLYEKWKERGEKNPVLGTERVEIWPYSLKYYQTSQFFAKNNWFGPGFRKPSTCRIGFTPEN